MDMDIFRNKIYIEEGVETCPKCRGSSTMSVTKQNRGADEMSAILIYCTECEYRWYAQ